jgi:hypothetical protein
MSNIGFGKVESYVSSGNNANVSVYQHFIKKEFSRNSRSSENPDNIVSEILLGCCF